MKKLVLALTAALAATLVAALPAPTSAREGSPEDVVAVIAPGRFDTVRIGDTLESAAESGYFALDVKTSCGTREIWPVKAWRRSIDVYPGYDETAGQVAMIGAFDDRVRTAKGIRVGSTLDDLRAAYGDRLLGPRTNDYGQWGYFLRVQRRWLGFGLDADAADGRPSGDAEIVLMEITKGRRPGLLRDGC
ncbi:hypothetical protein [Nocardioides currus]|uniref:Uncharacterized protein n=1 Tax=Nocardioides currus TaxID=2133958 RepID=A0A2R7Z3I1_9ACTN|nr:hypothetical protein [Nocardioides currus]PUA82816.1 hypothetical protein C7S10_03640 [Nocardioides currus]